MVAEACLIERGVSALHFLAWLEVSFLDGWGVLGGAWEWNGFSRVYVALSGLWCYVILS
jgi:hypothetical protein